jgi:hypothetical protein
MKFHTLHSFVLGLILAFAVPARAAMPLVLGTTYSGTLALPGETHTYTFSGTPGQRLYLDGLDSDNLSINFTLVSPSGATVYGGNHDYDSGPLVLMEPGTYSLIVDGSGATVGTYQFRLLDLLASPVLALGTALSGQLSPALACNIYQFNGTRGQRIKLLSDGYSSTQVQWQLLSPANVIMAYGQIYQDLGTFTLPLDGEYCVLIIGTTGGTTPVTFEVLASDVSDSTAPVSGFGTVRSGTVNANQTNSFAYTGPAGLPIYFDSLDTSGQSLVVDLIDPFGNNVFSIAETSDNGPYILPRSGTYTLNVRNLSGSSGNFNFRLLDLTGRPALGLNAAVSNVLAAPYQTDVYKIAGMAGQRLLFDTFSSTYVNSQVWLLGPNGQYLLSTTLFNDQGPVTLPYSGTCYLFLQSSAASSASYFFQMLDIAGQPPLPLNTDLVGTLGANTSLVYRITGVVGEQLYFNAKSVSAGGDYWTLYDAKNTPVAGTSLGNDFEFTFTYPGNYALVLAGGGNSVSYSNQVSTFSYATNALTLDVAVTNSIVNPGDQVFYTFTGTAGQRIYYDALNPATPSINATLISPTGVTFSLGNASYDHGPMSLTESGTYLLQFDGSGDTVGPIAFEVLDAGVQPPLPLDTNLSGMLAANTTSVYQLAGTKGQHLYFDAQQVDASGGYWNLYDPNNNYISGANLASDFEVTLPVQGKYLLVIAAGSVPIDFTNQVNTFSYRTNALTLGVAVTNSIGHPGDQVVYTFTATAGQRVFYDALNPNYPSIIATLVSPSGVTVFYQGNASYDMGPATLQESGVYRLVFDGSGDTVGGINYALLDVESQPALPLNIDLVGTLPANASKLYQLAGTNGEQLYFNSKGVSVGSASWTLYGPNDAYVSGASLNGDFAVTLPYSGTYAAVLSAGSVSVDYSNQVNTFSFQTNALVMGAKTTSTILNPGDQFSYTFNGTAGQRLYYDSRQTNYMNAYVTLIAPGGGTVFYANASYDLGPITLTQSGVYTLVINGAGDQTGTVSFSLLDLAAASPVTLSTTITDSLTDLTETRLYRFAGTAGQRVNLQGSGPLGSYVTWELLGLVDQVLGPVPYVSADIGVVTLPTTGNYVVAVIGPAFYATPLNYQVRLTDVSDAGSVTSGFGTVHSGTIGPNQTNTFTFTAPAGLPVYFDSQDTSGQVLVVDLVSPDSTLVFDVNETSDAGPYILPRSGTYTLSVRGYNGASGNYSFRLLELTASPSLSLNTVVSNTAANPYETDVYRFTSSPGQRLIYDAVMNDANYPSVYAQLLDPRYQTIGPNGSDFANDQGPFTIQYGGASYLFLHNNLSVPSPYAFQLLDIATQPVLSINTWVTNTLDVYPKEVFRYSGTAGQHLYFRGQPSNPSGYWILYDPNNNQVFGSGPGLTSDFEVTLPLTGSYALALNSYSASPGTEIFQVSDYLYFTNTYTVGTPLVDALTRPGERRFYTFTGTLGQRLVYDALTNDPPDPNPITVQLLNPLGIQEGPLGGVRFSTDRGPFTLQRSGTYTLVVDGNSSVVGTFAFALLDVSSQPALPINSAVTNTLGVYPLEVYRYAGTAGQQLYFRGQSGNPNGYWQLFDSINNQVAGGYAGLVSDMEVTLPLTGTYTLLLGNYGGTAQTETFSVNDFLWFTNSYTIGTPLVDALQRPGERRSYTFTGTVGQRLYYDALTNDPPDPNAITAQLFNPQGVPEGPLGGYRFSSDRGPFTLQQSGTYTLMVDGNVSAVGTFAFRLLDLSSQPLLPLGVPVTNILNPYPVVAYHYAGTAGQQLYFRGQSSNPSGVWALFDPNDAYVSGGYAGLTSDMEVKLPLDGMYELVLTSLSADAGTNVFQVNPFNYGEAISVNRAPVLSHIGNQATGEGQPLLFTAQASDPDNNALTFSLDPGAPAGASINPTTGAFSWTPAPTGFSLITNLTVRVTDNGIPSVSAGETISIAVIAGPVMITVQRTATTATVFWRTAPGKHYQLQYKNTLRDAAWTDLGPVLAATDFTTSEPDSTIGTNNQRYYRVRLLDPGP